MSIVFNQNLYLGLAIFKDIHSKNYLQQRKKAICELDERANEYFAEVSDIVKLVWVYAIS